MSKLFFILLNIIQVILFIIAYILDFLSRKKMGVMRHFVYKNSKLNETYNMENVINILCIIIILIAVFALINLIVFIYKRKIKICLSLKFFHKMYFYILNISLIILSILFIIFLKYFSSEKTLAYYYINLIFLIVYIIEFIKLIIYTIKAFIKS